MWEFITEHSFVIILVAVVSAIIVYIFIKQDISKKKIILKQEKVNEGSKKESIKEKDKTINIANNEPQKIVSETIKEENNISQESEMPRGERQESLDNFKNERLKSHVLQLKPTVQAIILKK